ncbi:MAG: nucleotidyltransferase family protein [Candidatus Aenigmatarchaeota archaeon]
MKAILLCGGFAKRMWPMTLHCSKILLDVAGKPVLNYTIEKLEKIDDIDEIILTINAKFEQDFKDWIKKNSVSKPIRLIVEPTLHEGEKFGAIKAIENAIEQTHIEDDILVLFGDNIDDLEFDPLISFFKTKKAVTTTAFDTQNLDVAKRMGVIEIDDNNRVTFFVEKPDKPKSTLISIGRQIYPKDVLHCFKEYIADDNPKDTPGFFLQWLYKKMPVYAFPFKGHWFDIGNGDILKAAEEWVKKTR